jgi:hypothetical protein
LNWETSVRYVFFRWWRADTKCSFVSAVILLFLAAIGQELLICYRTHLSDRSTGILSRASRALLHGISYYIGQVLMMAFMAYNGYFCFALVAGRTFGYLLCSVFWHTDSVKEISVLDGRSWAGKMKTVDTLHHQSCCS